MPATGPGVQPFSLSRETGPGDCMSDFRTELARESGGAGGSPGIIAAGGAFVGSERNPRNYADDVGTDDSTSLGGDEASVSERRVLCSPDGQQITLDEALSLSKHGFALTAQATDLVACSADSKKTPGWEAGRVFKARPKDFPDDDAALDFIEREFGDSFWRGFGVDPAVAIASFLNGWNARHPFGSGGLHALAEAARAAASELPLDIEKRARRLGGDKFRLFVRMIISAATGSSGFVEVSQRAFADQLGVERHTIRRYIAETQKLGLLGDVVMVAAVGSRATRYAVTSRLLELAGVCVRPVIEPHSTSPDVERVYGACLDGVLDLGATVDNEPGTKMAAYREIEKALAHANSDDLIRAAKSYRASEPHRRKGICKFFGSGEYRNYLPERERDRPVPEQVREMLALKKKREALEPSGDGRGDDLPATLPT
jgi:hypothetical protein